ncbi:MAG: CRISPR-associated endonuclease Cas1 [Methanobrevibacter sp. CfCl-M3]
MNLLLIAEKSKLSYRQNKILAESDDKKEEYSFSDIEVVLIESTQCRISSYLLNKLADENKIVIFCDNKHIPNATLVDICSNYDILHRLKLQINCSNNELFWDKLVSKKIQNQIDLLEISNNEENLDLIYKQLNSDNSIESKEANIARIYFKGIFSSKFSRNSEHYLNKYLNYGYMIIRAIICQTIISKGLHPTLGIHHHSKLNQYNLADDFLEVYRILVDQHIYFNLKGKYDFTKTIKLGLLNLLNTKIQHEKGLVRLRQSIDYLIDDYIEFLENGDLEIDFPDIRLYD